MDSSNWKHKIFNYLIEVESTTVKKDKISLVIELYQYLDDIRSNWEVHEKLCSAIYEKLMEFIHSEPELKTPLSIYVEKWFSKSTDKEKFIANIGGFINLVKIQLFDQDKLRKKIKYIQTVLEYIKKNRSLILIQDEEMYVFYKIIKEKLIQLRNKQPNWMYLKDSYRELLQDINSTLFQIYGLRMCFMKTKKGRPCKNFAKIKGTNEYHKRYCGTHFNFITKTFPPIVPPVLVDMICRYGLWS